MSATTLHPEMIRSQLRIKFGTISRFEDVRGLPTRSVSDVLRGRSIRRTEEAIAIELGIELHQVSSRYSVGQSTNVDNTTVQARSHRLNAGAR